MAIAPVFPLSILSGVAGTGAILISAGRPRSARLLDRFLRWQDGKRQRTALMDLDARLLRDARLTRDQAECGGRRHD